MGEEESVFCKSVAPDAPVDDHTSRNIWAAQLGLDRNKSAPSRVWRRVRREGGMDLGRVGGGTMNLVKTYYILKELILNTGLLKQLLAHIFL